ncbi:alanyl-tRNA synthetase [Pedobacter cryoconitis]|uniref:Alanyl-tRNA synthetase n=1 Tax=Pedobacter cryoconitis TaxID=188932 RepID=A0A7W8ZS74_9SPHI|nr:hypothetical protein [Pedobacter cryoconitis]MBB5639005.1 alanyl-tRNA synthetase [Pedobacter cryoconitis]
MKTKILYFDAPKLTQNNSIIVFTGTDERGFYLIPNESCFFPGGGGQETDKGELVINGEFFNITNAKFIDKQLRIYVDQTSTPLYPGLSADIIIDPVKRSLNSLLHSAGHLLSSVVYEELRLDLQPIKGFHFEAGSHVEFISKSGINQVDLNEINYRLQQNVAAKHPFTSKIVSSKSKEYEDAFSITGFSPEEDDAVRLVTIGGFLSYACGGTHVEHTGCLEGLKVNGYKQKKGNLKIKYGFEKAVEGIKSNTSHNCS